MAAALPSTPALDCNPSHLGHYDLGVHIGGAFIILSSSAVGVMLPIFVGWWKPNNLKISELDAASFGRRVGVWGSLFFIARHFGTGVIMGTAFIHLIYDGFNTFSNPCIGHLTFPAVSPLLVAVGVLLTFFIDYAGSRATFADLRSVQQSSGGMDASVGPEHIELGHSATCTPPTPNCDSNVSTTSYDGTSKSWVSNPKHNQRCQSDVGVEVIVAPGPAIPPQACCADIEKMLQREQSWQAIVLEIGIIFHSVMIGVTLGAAHGHGWLTLMIAIVFHQVFEGAALGARIALLHWLPRLQAGIMGAAFSLITPMGMAIGIGIHQSFRENARSSLLVVGTLDSACGGILLYSLFRVINVDFMSGPLREAPLSTGLSAIGALLLGMIAMTVIGTWA